MQELFTGSRIINDFVSYYDVAIWEMEEEVEFNDFVRPICLPERSSHFVNEFEGDQVTATGKM